MTQTLNIATLSELQSILEDELFAITGVFAEQVDAEVEALLSGASAGDLAHVNRRAHALKGSAANVGADALSHHAATIEKAAKAGDAETVKELAADLAALVSDTLRDMRAQGFLAS